MKKEPLIKVGIMHEPTIQFELMGTYRSEGTCNHPADTTNQTVSGLQSATLEPDGSIRWNGQAWESLSFLPMEEEAQFELKDVTIGINFHWQRKENQRFKGALALVPEGGKLWAVNVLPAEDYLTSVISSEMSAKASLGLLKAHAVISRSWLLANLRKESHPAPSADSPQTDEEGLKWYERDAHTLFDVCADDHCQRYQGMTRANTPAVEQAVKETRGEVLLDEAGQICDARFSKCCGGAFEEFQYCWAPHRYHYLTRAWDGKPDAAQAPLTLPDLTREEEAERWILSTPPAFCNTHDASILSQVLNNYDQETQDFYRWQVEYTGRELSELIKERSGVDFGDIIDLKPLARGTSGRLWKLQVVGTKRQAVVGKELEIRRILSKTHLYSSAFVVRKKDFSPEGVPGHWTLTGAGWGHGVGLCQIGAAVMGARGYDYRDILSHYFQGATIETIYN